MPIKEASHPVFYVLFFLRTFFSRFVLACCGIPPLIGMTFSGCLMGMIPSEFLLKIPRGQAIRLWAVVPIIEASHSGLHVVFFRSIL